MVKGTITFGQLMYLSKTKTSWDYKELFQIPNFKRVSRKEGMKMMNSKKKRLAVANVIT